jgi:hypothetical protein
LRAALIHSCYSPELAEPKPARCRCRKHASGAALARMLDQGEAVPCGDGQIALVGRLARLPRIRARATALAVVPFHENVPFHRPAPPQRPYPPLLSLGFLFLVDVMHEVLAAFVRSRGRCRRCGHPFDGTADFFHCPCIYHCRRCHRTLRGVHTNTWRHARQLCTDCRIRRCERCNKVFDRGETLVRQCEACRQRCRRCAPSVPSVFLKGGHQTATCLQNNNPCRKCKQKAS